MRKNESVESKIFYFSSTHGVLSRIFNLQCDPQLIFMHFVLNNAYANINGRINALKRGDLVIQFHPKFFEKLTESVEVLASKIEKDEDTFKTLEQIALLTFLTTGNGYYLFEKGMINLF